MAVDLSPIDESLLAEIANMHGMPKGAFNVRKDGELVERHSSAYIDISTKTDNPGIDIRIADGTKGETVYIPVIVTKSGLKDVVYNTFYVGENCDITIIAGCGIHNDSHDASEHDGIHSFYLGKNSRVRYVEKHYGEGDGSGERILNPTTNVYMEEGSSCEMEMVQLRGVTSTVRDTNAELGADAKLVLTEKLLTHGNQKLVFIAMSRKFFPAGICGLLLAAIIAASISTADSQLLVASSSFTADLYKPFFRKGASEKETLLVGRVLVLVLSLIAFAIANSKGSGAQAIMDMVENAWGAFGSSFGPTILLSLFWKRFNYKGAVAGVVSGFVVDLGWLLSGLTASTGVYEIVPGFIVSFLAAYLVARFTEAPNAEAVAIFEEATKPDAD